MSETCRAVVFSGDGTYEIRSFEIPSPPEGGALVKVEAVGMCSSDVAQIDGHKHVPGEVAPVVPGHEIVGRIERLAGDAALGVSVGDRVAIDLVNRKTTYNKRLIVYGYTLGVDDGSGLWGGFGEYMCVMPGTNLMKLTESVPAEHLTIFEPLASAVNWVEQAGVKQGDTVMVLGPGHVGLMCVVAAKAAGASTIIVSGTSADKLRLDAALKAGAQHVINVDEGDVIARVNDITRRRRADVVLEATSMSKRAVEQALDLTRYAGTVLLAGLKNREPVKIVTDTIVLNSLTVKGGSGSTEASMQAAVDLLNQGQVPTDVLLGEVFGIDDFDEAMMLLRREHPERDAIRVTLRH